MMYFTYGGESSADYNVFISGEATFDVPKRKTTKASVAGRNGDIILTDEDFENIEVKYPAFILEHLPDRFGALQAMMASKSGYVRLEDTYHPEEYRMAHYEAGASVKTGALNRSGKFEIKFDCMPQRFLKVGEKAISFDASGEIINHTRFPSKPMLRVYGVGNLTISGQVIAIASADGYTDIDCEIMEAYKGTVNKNASVTLPDALVLSPGANTITLGSGITEVIILPRWWTI